jgi:putative PEP-CTERM system TPR-repeat lipoprotein
MNRTFGSADAERRKTSIRARAFALALGAAFIAGCSGEDPAALLASAKSYLAKKDDRAAVVQLKNALQRRPDFPEARFLLGRTLLEGGDPVGAEVELRKALALKHPASVVAPLLVRSLVAQGKGQVAIKEYGATILEDPAANAELKTALATAYVQQGDRDKARATLEDALRTAPDAYGPLLMLARMKAAANDVDGALASLDRILAKEPANYEALQVKGDLLYAAKGDMNAALRAQRQALKARPDWLPAHASILEIALERRDLPAARAQLEQLKKILPEHPQTRYYEARVALQGHDYKTAREKSEQVLAVAPEDARVLLLAGAAAVQTGSLPRAESLVGKALQKAPWSVTTRQLLAQIHLRRGQAKKAQETLRPLLERQSVDADTLNLAAQASLQLGEVAEAEAYFGRAAKQDPKNPQSRTALALAEFAHGKPEIAFAQLQEIASSDPGTVADQALISMRLRQRDFDGALRAIDVLERKQPDKPLAAFLRGQAQMAREDVTGARQSFAKALAMDPLYFPAAAQLATLDLRENKPDEARKRFENLLAIDPKNVRSLITLAELRARAGGSREEVLALVDKAIRLNPSEAAPRALLIELHLGANDNRSALAAAQAAVAALPEVPELLELLGRAQLASSEAIQATATFGKFAILRPNSPQPLLGLADAYLVLKKPADARDAVNRAIALAPQFVPAQRALIIVELAAGRPEQAMAVARNLQKQRPNESVGYMYAGDIEASRSDVDTAAATYRAGLVHAPSFELAAKLHALLIKAKRSGEADSVATAWIKQHPEDTGFRTYLGEAAIVRRDFTGAEAQYLVITKLQPDNAFAWNNLAWATNSLKKPTAMAYAERANALQPNRPDFLDTLATVLADNGQVAKALEVQKKAVALGPDSPLLRLNLAKLYLKSGDKGQAKVELVALAKLGPKFAAQAEVDELLKTL